ncbi:MAG: heme NO-binding domain-containing protein [Campylobacterota bacterium]|nr:heme NO-binding domain-containing protein [Campylobacterota bacterium]
MKGMVFTDIPIPTLLEVYGVHLFPKLINVLPQFNNQDTDLLEFIESVENHIHVEVRKLYPDAELPTFEVVNSNSNELQFNYISKKNIPQLAKGLILGASKHFNKKLDVDFKHTEDGKILFTVKKVS